MLADTSPRVHVCVLCSSRVRSRRRRVGSAMNPRRRNGWKPKPELKSWLRLLPPQVEKPETEGFKRWHFTTESLEALKGPSFHPSVCFPEQHTIGFSQSSLIHLVGPLDCTLHNYSHGGQSLSLPFSSSSCSYNPFVFYFVE